MDESRQLADRAWIGVIRGIGGEEDEQFSRYYCNFSPIIIHIPLLTSVSYSPLPHLYI